MRLPAARRPCGPLLELGWISRLLHLGQPIPEGIETVTVAQIIGTAHRGRDFDGCWHATEPHLARRIDEIAAASPTGLDEPIEAVRIDRAYFVVDGHKRVAIAKRSGREFLDARISRVPTPYELGPDLETGAILRTGREAEFRRHSGVAAAQPDARFALTDVDDYGELLHAVQSHAYELGERRGQLPPRHEAADDWYRSDYLPTVERIRGDLGEILRPCTDADLYLLVHRQRLAFWGTECDAPECAPDRVLLQRRLDARGSTRIAKLLPRFTATEPVAPLLPLSDESSHD
ncbi:MAG TPA: hypothetical protein VLA76_08860 [Candidatus Angelobacter sp.]|nr:hypothetical protein [Candidatus Angelobacter sp.]